MNKKMWYWRLLLFGTFIAAVNADGEKVLKIAQGTLKGVKTTTSFRNIPYFSFKGIPYAQPLLGPHKFDLARPAKAWRGILDASYHRSICPQMDLETFDITGNEDCLYLNVYTPYTQKDKCFPVMVYFYAGLFQMGSGNDDYYGPDFLVEKNVVVVTFNFRLGPLGFLSTEDGSAPGNMGLKDQVLALKWVRDNIEYFGGCHDQVTLFGQSSGATAVNLHMMSPLSQGLFRAAIIQSSSAVTWWSISHKPRQDAFALGAVLGIRANSTKSLVDGLKEKSTEEILNAVGYMYMEDETENQVVRDDIFPFGPSVETYAGQEVFLPADPWKMLRSGKISDVPVIIGVTADEGAVLSKDFLSYEVIQLIFLYLCNSLHIHTMPEKVDIEEEISRFYLDDQNTFENKAEKSLQWLSDMAINIETLMTAKIMAYRNKEPVYEYLFDYKASFGFFKEVFQSDYGAAHGDDLTYLFYANKYKHKQNTNISSTKIIDIMTKLWTNFARDLDPTLKTDNDINFSWYPMHEDGWYLNINTQPTMKQHLFKDNVEFWVPIYRNFLLEYMELFQ